MSKAKINASVGVGPFRIYTDFSPWAPVIGFLIGAAILMFFYFYGQAVAPEAPAPSTTSVTISPSWEGR